MDSPKTQCPSPTLLSGDSIKINFNKLAAYGTDGRLFTSEVSAKFKVT